MLAMTQKSRFNVVSESETVGITGTRVQATTGGMTEPNPRSGIGILNLQGSSQGGSQITYPYLQNVLSRANLDTFTGN